jgi:catechol 2,3-dioxygenase-like lactoylglutathione lyase family enzyme
MVANAIIMARPQNQRTTVRKHIKGIDHVVIAVRDLDSAQDTFRRMGFTLTPRGHHTLGSQNHCVMFGEDYIELLMVPQRLPGREYYYDFARVGDGLAAVALKTDNARGAFGELTAAALAPSEPVDFSRPVQLAQGPKTASFRITQLGLEQTPGGQVFLCQHFTRDVVWRPEYQTHANTATGLAALAIVSADVGATAAAYERLFDVKARAIDEGLLVNTGDTPLAIVNEPALAKRLPGVWISARHQPCMAALFIRVGDREIAQRTLRAGGLHPTRMPDGSVAVGAPEAHGVAMVFG